MTSGWHGQSYVSYLNMTALNVISLLLQTMPLAYLAGLSLVPRQFYQERQHIMPGSINYIALSDGADSPLLFDREATGIYEESGGQFRNTRLSMETVKEPQAEK